MNKCYIASGKRMMPFIHMHEIEKRIDLNDGNR